MNCEIRKWELSDADQLALIVNNKKLQDCMNDGLPFPYTSEDAKHFINLMLNSDHEKIYSFAIVVDDKLAGTISFMRGEKVSRLTAEVGYYVGEDYWGQGIMTKALNIGCKYIFDNTDVVRIFAKVYENNISSCKVLEKSGFELEGTMRKNAIKNDQIIDMKLYSLVI